jgi:hypothetical protein
MSACTVLLVGANRYGAKVNCRSLNNVRPIELAAQHGHHDAVEVSCRVTMCVCVGVVFSACVELKKICFGGRGKGLCD